MSWRQRCTKVAILSARLPAEAADSFAQRCREHEAMRTNSPELDAPGHEWDSWSEKNRMWELTHPAAPLSGRESYDVMPLTFDPS